MTAETENPLQNVTFPSNGHQAHGYLVKPPSGTGPGLIVIQEWWGLTDQIGRTADQLAEQGFVCLAPDLFGGRTTHDGDEAGEIMGTLDFGRAAQDLAGAVDYLLADESVTGKVGAIGFCMGGGFVIALAAQVGDKLSAAVPFYGVVRPDFDGWASITAPVQGHFAEQDEMTPPNKAREIEQKIRAGGAEAEFFIYAGAGHAFCNDDNILGTWNPEACELAMGRAVAFLKERLG
ncbi:MAG: carboxymethylenebutenolidase [Frankiales bacterium]|nr:carboxymethylenebutenolidase [Frankiales bacterium]